MHVALAPLVALVALVALAACAALAGLPGFSGPHRAHQCFTHIPPREEVESWPRSNRQQFGVPLWSVT